MSAGKVMGQRLCHSNEWRQVVKSHYGQGRVRRLKEIRSHNTHFVYSELHGKKFIVSKVDKRRGRLPFTLQFEILEMLCQARVPAVSLPISRVSMQDGNFESPYWVDYAHSYWFVRHFVEHDSADWSEPALLEEAAETLARIHAADSGSSTYQRDLPAPQIDPYYWSVQDVLGRFHTLIPRLRCHLMSYDEANNAVIMARELPREAQALDFGPIGLTHADFRPENVLVRDGRIVEVIDWDRARPDLQLFDAVLAGLQFARWSGRHDLQVAYKFVDAYRAVRALQIDDDAVEWMYRFVLVKALLLSHNPDRWMPLFRAYAGRPAPGALIP